MKDLILNNKLKQNVFKKADEHFQHLFMSNEFEYVVNDKIWKKIKI